MGYESEKLKEQILMRDVMEKYGIDINSAGFAICPFHNEKTPSLKIYERYYKCFGCNASGDIISFIMKICNVLFKDAVKRIQSDFGLIAETYSENKEWEEKKRERKRIKTEKEVLYQKFIRIREEIEKFEPVIIDGEVIITDRWVAATNKIDRIEHELGIIQNS